MARALFVLMALCNLGNPGNAATNDMAFSAPKAALVAFIPVCRDDRGTWDRRACHHVRRGDPARLTLA